MTKKYEKMMGVSEFFNIKFLPENVSINVKKGTTIFEAAEEAGLSINTECGGYGRCGKCKVKIIKGSIKKYKHRELSDEEIKNNIQLACFSKIDDDFEVYIPKKKELEAFMSAQTQKILYKNEFIKDSAPFAFNYKPLSEKMTLTIDSPHIDHNPDDFNRIKMKLGRLRSVNDIRCPISVLKKLPDEIRKKEGTITLTISESRDLLDIINISSYSKEEYNYGLAVDVGTTSVAVMLVNLGDGKVVSEKSEYNRQILYGPDVINRIIYASKKGGLEKLRDKVLSTINNLIDSILKETGIERHFINSCSISGNTTMQHLLLGINPKYIREEPYVPAVLHFPNLRADDVMLNINPNGIVYITPGVASYVGGDITAGILRAGINRSKELTLYIDLGTNGEIVLGNSDWMTACACSAGPAFEGGGLKCGMRAETGAIEKIKINQKTGFVEYKVVGGGKPKGICGSAVIDIISELYFSDNINQKGKFNFESKNKRFRKKKTYNEFVIVYATETLMGEDIVITEPDLDSLIRTKGAVWAGISTLLKAVDIKHTDIDRVIIAGTFGYYINIENAILIGMMPDIPIEKFSFIGNGSLQGAALTLISNELRSEIEEISKKITNFELSSTPGYMEEFIASLFIPHTEIQLFPSFIKKKNSTL